ncbi:carbohydrate binding protein [Pelomyxa schiedti]|nr:carbohydrate binding protein [Pelomyxa schiedti]
MTRLASLVFISAVCSAAYALALAPPEPPSPLAALMRGRSGTSPAAQKCCWCDKYYNATANSRELVSVSGSWSGRRRGAGASTELYAAPMFDPYTFESMGAVLARMFIPSLKKVDFSLMALYAGSSIGLSSWQWDPAYPHKSFEVEFSLDKLPMGKSELEIRLIVDGVTVSTTDTYLTRLVHTDYTVKIDNRAKSLIVDRIPFIPFGFFHEFDVTSDGPDTPQAAALATVTNGFNVFAVWTYINASIPSQRSRLLAYLDQCSKINAKAQILLTGISELPDSPTKWAQLSDILSAVSTHPALLSYFLADEPDGWNDPSWPAILQQTYDYLKENDPYHPVIINLNCMHTAATWSPMADILMSDPYPIGLNNPVGCDECVGSVVDVATRFDTMNKDLYYMKPLWFIPQLFGNSEHWDREPTGREQEAMTYIALIHGVTGIQSWIHTSEFPVSHNAWDRCSELAIEVAELTPAIDSHLTAASGVSAEGIHWAEWQESNAESALVLAVNPGNTPTSFEICVTGFDWYNYNATVLFENWVITLQSGCISDTLAPLGTRAYLLEMTGVPKVEGSVLNPSFEVAHSAGSPDSFYKVSPQLTLSTTFTDTRVAHHGAHSLRLVTDNVDVPAKMHSMSFVVQNDSQVSVWGYGEKDLHFSLCVSSACETFSMIQRTDSYEWNQYIMSSVVTAGTSVTVYLTLNDIGVAWFDLIEFNSL